MKWIRNIGSIAAKPDKTFLILEAGSFSVNCVLWKCQGLPGFYQKQKKKFFNNSFLLAVSFWSHEEAMMVYNFDTW